MDIIGHILASAYFDDEEFRAAIKPINEHLQGVSNEIQKQIKCFDSEADYMPHMLLSMTVASSFNTYIVSSYHAAKACELFSKEAIAKIGDEDGPSMIGTLMTLQHAHGLEAVFNLAYTKGLLTNERFTELAQVDGRKIDEIFNELFPNLHDARNALAHQDERVLGIVGFGKAENAKNSAIMIHSQRGSQFENLIRKRTIENDKAGEFESFNFSFASDLYLKLVDQLIRYFP
jgi:hypothetical protein